MLHLWCRPQASGHVHRQQRQRRVGLDSGSFQRGSNHLCVCTSLDPSLPSQYFYRLARTASADCLLDLLLLLVEVAEEARQRPLARELARHLRVVEAVVVMHVQRLQTAHVTA